MRSLYAQLHEGPIKVVIVDRFCVEPEYVSHRSMCKPGAHIWGCPRVGVEMDFVLTPPKPTVWQGKHRLTSEDYFAPSNARNTAICLAEDGWIAFVDDLSVLLPGWLAAVKEAMQGKYIALGAYKKVKKLVVENGQVMSFEPFPAGVDSRLGRYPPGMATPAPGSDLFGCSFAMPVESALAVNGFDENCDSMGGEDYTFGIILGNAGFTFKYDPRMMTYESEEHHNVLGEPPIKRMIKPSSMGSKDASWDMLHSVRGRAWSPNYFGAEGIRGLRKRILAGEPFPITQIPEHHWVDGQPLKDM